ncbi:MAG TPA: hypothetical protein VK403_10900 [Allosphingosinicella sp.]|nr:hypothetical protein [Allosphingosinicella sp.]
MSVNLPSHFDFGIDLGLGLSGIPTSYSIGISNLPKINVGIDPIRMQIDPIEIRPMEFSFRLKEIPSVRMHFPTDYRICFGLLGTEVASIRLCGQAQVITEPYVPNPCECVRGRAVGGGIANVAEPTAVSG